MLTRPQSARPRPRPRPRPQTYDQGQAKAKVTEVKAKAKVKAKTRAVTVKTNQFNCRPNDSGFFMSRQNVIPIKEHEPNRLILKHIICGKNVNRI